MDDGVVWVLGKENALALGRRVRKDLKDYVFLIAEDKSAWGAQRELLWVKLDRAMESIRGLLRKKNKMIPIKEIVLKLGCWYHSGQLWEI